MKKKNNNFKIAIIGPYPPPYGGISIHIQRLKEQLERRKCECVIYNLGGQNNLQEENIIKIKSIKKWLPQYFLKAKEDVIHYHNSDWRLRIIMGLMQLGGKKTIISIHGESLSDSLKSGGWFKKQIIKFGLRQVSFIIAGNSKIKEVVLSLGVNPNRVEVIPAFIPPIVKEEQIADVPQSVWDFMASHKPVISANASKIVFYEGIDLYGLDMIIELIDKLTEKYPKAGLVFCLPSIGDKSYFGKISRRIEEKGLQGNILFITETFKEAYPIWRESNIFVRPTVTDGDSLSVREAIYFQTPVIASDACPRPEGVTLFKNRDTRDFIEKTEKVLDNYGEYKSKAKKLDSGNGFDKIMEIYNELAK